MEQHAHALGRGGGFEDFGHFPQESGAAAPVVCGEAGFEYGGGSGGFEDGAGERGVSEALAKESVNYGGGACGGACGLVEAGIERQFGEGAGPGLAGELLNVEEHFGEGKEARDGSDSDDSGAFPSVDIPRQVIVPGIFSIELEWLDGGGGREGRGLLPGVAGRLAAFGGGGMAGEFEDEFIGHGGKTEAVQGLQGLSGDPFENACGRGDGAADEPGHALGVPRSGRGAKGDGGLADAACELRSDVGVSDVGKHSEDHLPEFGECGQFGVFGEFLAQEIFDEGEDLFGQAEVFEPELPAGLAEGGGDFFRVEHAFSAVFPDEDLVVGQLDHWVFRGGGVGAFWVRFRGLSGGWGLSRPGKFLMVSMKSSASLNRR